MAKKLKKKIEDICGLAGLDWETRQARATEILSSNDWKQRLCNELMGLSYRELERTLKSVASERQVKAEDEKVYKNEKLKSYSNGHTSSKVGRSPQRTLAEILAQVHAPRIDERWEGSSFTSLRGTEENTEVFSDLDDGTFESEE